MLAMSPEVVLFIELQLPATILLGLVAGFLVARIFLIRRGRVSLRANAAIVLIAALEAAVVARRPAPWPYLAPIFLAAATASGLTDAWAILVVDPWRAVPRFSEGGRRLGAGMVAAGLAALLVAAAPVVKYVLALNPAGVSLWDGPLALLVVLVPIATVDLAVRGIHQKVTGPRRGDPTPLPPGPVPPGAP